MKAFLNYLLIAALLVQGCVYMYVLTTPVNGKGVGVVFTVVAFAAAYRLWRTKP